MRERGDRPYDIRNLVDDVLSPKPGDVNEPLEEHESLLHETKALRNRFGEKRRQVPEENRFEAGMYGAAYNLADAIGFVLAETPDVSKIDPETQTITSDSGNIGRDMFVNSIKRALKNLGLEDEILKGSK